jgi:hypothetical protein
VLSRWFLAWLILRHWRWRRHVPPKYRLAFKGIHVIPDDRTLEANSVYCLLLAGCLTDLLFCPDDGDSTPIRRDVKEWREWLWRHCNYSRSLDLSQTKHELPPKHRLPVNSKHVKAVNGVYQTATRCNLEWVSVRVPRPPDKQDGGASDTL